MTTQYFQHLYDLLEGGAYHDIYHLGQINLIAALLKHHRSA